jgi:hypothetical protein
VITAIVTGRINGQEIPVEFAWDVADPYAARITFPGGVEWHVDRELLAAGLQRRVGEGDVRIWPTSANEFCLHLRTPRAGHCYIALPRAPIDKFSAQVQATAAWNTPQVSMDDELDRLLGRSA